MLADGTHAYLYGVGRLAQHEPGGWVYHHGDALGSVRQLTDPAGSIMLGQSYRPYGNVLTSSGSGVTPYGFTGEWTDGTGLVYLRGRYYDTTVGRFLSRDTWDGHSKLPMSYNAWLYVYNNPIKHTDPSGRCLDEDLDGSCDFPPGDPSDLPPNPVPGGISCHWLSPPGECIPLSCTEDPPGSANGWKSAGVYNLSAYYVTHESQYYSGAGSSSGPVPSLDNITANQYFLFSQGGVCTQGTGKLKDGRYIGCTTNIWSAGTIDVTISNQWGIWNYTMPLERKKYREYTPFFWKSELRPPKYQAFETAAVCSSGAIPRDPDGGVEIRINHDAFSNIMESKGADNILNVTDVGGGLCSTHGIDVYLGEQLSYQEDPANLFFRQVALPIIGMNAAHVEWRDLR